MPRAAKVCSRSKCPEIATFRGMCPLHAREYESERGPREHNTYRFKKASREAKRAATNCVECGQPFTRTNPATGGHVRPVRDGGTTADGIVPQCRRCNYGWRRTGL